MWYLNTIETGGDAGGDGCGDEKREEGRGERERDEMAGGEE